MVKKMTALNCKSVRREIDEATLSQQLTREAIEHLRACAGCRRFHEEYHALRGLMASLETVTAPADFDFRLRARLAAEKERRTIAFPFARVSLATRVLSA